MTWVRKVAVSCDSELFDRSRTCELEVALYGTVTLSVVRVVLIACGWTVVRVPGSPLASARHLCPRHSELAGVRR